MVLISIQLGVGSGADTGNRLSLYALLSILHRKLNIGAENGTE